MTEPTSIVCIGFWSEYDQYFLEYARSRHYQVEVLNPYRELAKTVDPKYLPKPLRTYLLKNTTEKLLKTHSNQFILLQDERVLIDALISIEGKMAVSILMRNSLIESKKIRSRIPAIQQRGYPVWSFDEEDCERHGFRRYEQFISKVGQYENTPVQTDFGFIGKDKGRKEQLEFLRQKLTKMGYQCEIDLRVGARKKESGKVDLAYKEYLQQACQARCIIDIVQNQQAGITLRPLEATIYQRKLITNSNRVKDLAFYNPNNIFVIGSKDWNNLPNFMETPFNAVDEKQLLPYMTESMLSKVIQ